MVSVTSFFHGKLPQDASVRLLQSAWQTSPQGRWGAGARLDISGRNAGADAVSAIMQIILDAKGNASVAIHAPQATARVGTGDGDDTIVVNAREARIHSGSGDDIVDVTVANDAGGQVSYVNAGDGDDIVNVKAISGRPLLVHGGAGNDAISIEAQTALMGIKGGSGDDTIDIVSEHGVVGVFGGEGDDTISIEATAIHLVKGGRGDDHIVLNNTRGGLSSIFLAEGDGNDIVETSGPLEIFRTSADGTRGMNDATITRMDDGTFAIAFANSNDTLIVKLSGVMAEADEIVLDHDPVGGAMIIRPAGSDVSTTFVTSFTRAE